MISIHGPSRGRVPGFAGLLFLAMVGLSTGCSSSGSNAGSGANAVKLWTPSAGGVFSVAVDSSNVYFAECANDSQPARLRRIPKAGGTADVIASDSIGGYGFAGRNCEFSDNVMFGSTPLRVLALDAGYAYWSNGQHVIRRIAK